MIATAVCNSNVNLGTIAILPRLCYALQRQKKLNASKKAKLEALILANELRLATSRDVGTEVGSRVSPTARIRLRYMQEVQ